jgi:hypothetical protein
VSRAKLARELAAFSELSMHYRKRGIWLLRAEFPTVEFAFLAAKIKPVPVVFGALIDFTNYDLWPPSVTIVDPLTFEPYTADKIPTKLAHKVIHRQTVTLPDGGGTQVLEQNQFVGLLQHHNPTDVPFLCLPGVREYHDHPGHTGDHWMMRRGLGEGTLAFILEQLDKYGTAPFTSYHCKITAKVEVAGLQLALPTSEFRRPRWMKRAHT